MLITKMRKTLQLLAEYGGVSRRGREGDLNVISRLAAPGAGPPSDLAELVERVSVSNDQWCCSSCRDDQS